MSDEYWDHAEADEGRGAYRKDGTRPPAARRASGAGAPRPEAFRADGPQRGPERQRPDADEFLRMQRDADWLGKPRSSSHGSGRSAGRSVLIVVCCLAVVAVLAFLAWSFTGR